MVCYNKIIDLKTIRLFIKHVKYKCQISHYIFQKLANRERRCHCVIDVALSSVERLHRHQVYPIVLLIRFKSTKQIKEVKDTRYPLDKVTAKAAKEMYEHALKLESEYKHYISSVIPAGVNVAYMCTQIKAAVDMEQSKTLWVPCPNM